MTEKEWLDCTNVVSQNEFLLAKGRGRKLQLFLCACWWRAYNLLSEKLRRKVSRMPKHYGPQPDMVLGDIWQVSQRTVEVAERFADGRATKEECQEAAERASAMSQHYGYIAACAPSPGEDPKYDSVSVLIGGDAAGAAEYAALVIPSTAELTVRVAASCAAPDDEAYYAGAHGSPDIDPNNPHLLARRDERAAEWKLLVDVFGEKLRRRKINSVWLSWQDGTVIKLAQSIYDQRLLPTCTFDLDRLAVLADALEDAGCNDAAILEHLRGPGPHVRGCWAIDLLLNKK